MADELDPDPEMHTTRELLAEIERLQILLADERLQVAVEVGETERLEGLLEAERRLRTGLVVTADSLARKLSEVEAENERLREVVMNFQNTHAALDTAVVQDASAIPDYLAFQAALDVLLNLDLGEI